MKIIWLKIISIILTGVIQVIAIFIPSPLLTYLSGMALGGLIISLVWDYFMWNEVIVA